MGNMNKAVLIGVCLDNRIFDKYVASLDELERLADTAGVETVAKVIQKRQKVDKTFYAGKGFLADAVGLMEEHDAGLLIFDNELSPTQGRNIEKFFEIDVSDRTEVILDIFHDHAQTKEAKLQVKLAELQYQLPRLKKLWNHLDREGGGGGAASSSGSGGSGGATRGMGETQIEIDKRLVRDDIAKVKAALRRIELQKETQGKQRENIKKVCLVGYTNAGKSTLFNRLTDAGVLVEDKLFATLSTTNRKLEMEKGHGIILSDTVGFISDLPHHLVASFRATLGVIEDADLLLHTVDSSDEHLAHYTEEVEKVLEQIGAHEIPELMVFNKMDKADPIRLKFLTRSKEHSLAVSAKDGINTDVLLEKIDEMLFNSDRYELLIPHTDQKAASRLFELAEIESKEYVETGLKVTAVIHHNDLPLFEKFKV